MADSDVIFVVHRLEDRNGRWAYIDKCPHGMDLGAIHLGPSFVDERTPEETAALKGWENITWQFQDLGNGRCKISPSILAKGVHPDLSPPDCHFGPGEFKFVWLEEGEHRNGESFLARYNERVK